MMEKKLSIFAENSLYLYFARFAFIRLIRTLSLPFGEVGGAYSLY